MPKDLRQFLQLVREAGPDYYVEVKRPLKPDLEACIIQEKLARDGRFPVIYCPQVEGSKIPLVTNLLGSNELLGLALEVSPGKAEASTAATGGLAGAVRAAKTGEADILQGYKRREHDLKPPQMVPVSRAPVKEVMMKGSAVDLGLLPITRHHDLDSGKYVTIGVMICKDPDTGIPNAGVYRHEVKAKDKLGAMFSTTQHAKYIARRYAELGKPMEVVLFIGHHPAVVIGSQVRGSMDMNELEVMGGLLGEPLQLTRAETVDLPVPAYAEIAIEGVLDARNMITDGPFAEYSGYYGEPKQPCYLIQVNAITMRKDAIYHDLDPAHREHVLSGNLPMESSLYDAVKRVIPTLKAVHCVPSASHFMAYISIKKRVAGEGKAAALTAVRTANPRIVVVVDDDIDVYNQEEVSWAIATRLEASTGVSIIPNAPGQHLDPTAYDETHSKRGSMTTKLIMDATRPVETPFATRIVPRQDLWEATNLADFLK